MIAFLLRGRKEERRWYLYNIFKYVRVLTKRSGMDHTVLPANNTIVPAFPSWAFTRWCHHNWGGRHPVTAYYSFIDPKRMKGWVGLGSNERVECWPMWLWYLVSVCRERNEQHTVSVVQLAAHPVVCYRRRCPHDAPRCHRGLPAVCLHDLRRRCARSLRHSRGLYGFFCFAQEVRDRAFSVARPTVWNSLPFDISHITDTAVFKHHLKTHI